MTGKVLLLLAISHVVVYWWGRADGRKSVTDEVKGFVQSFLQKRGK